MILKDFWFNFNLRKVIIKSIFWWFLKVFDFNLREMIIKSIF